MTEPKTTQTETTQVDQQGPAGLGRRVIHPAIRTPPGPPNQSNLKLDKIVFGVAAVLALAFCVWGFANPIGLGAASSSALDWIETNLGWFFVVVATGFVVYVIWLAASKFGRIPLGRDDEAPEFKTVSWIAMMFSAGMGIGLMFFGVNEPLTHFVEPPPGTAEAGTDAALKTAMATTLFHWTLHPWAIYAVVGLAIAYGTFRLGRKQLISSAFAGLFGRRQAEGPAGKVIDILAIFATLFGSATSLGLGALQIGSGLQLVSGIGEVGNGILIAIIVILTIAFILSAVSGVAKGIQLLSNVNMVLAVILAFFVFVVGPTVFILNLIPTAVGSYFSELADMAARTEASGGDAMTEWLKGMTVFYWAWWISWTPFVGVFIARISRGRTIRQFVSGVLLMPSLVSLVWFCVFGGTAIFLQRGGIDLAAQESEEAQLFGMLDQLPVPQVTAVLVMILVAIFFVSGADAASVVMGTLSQSGSLEPGRLIVIFWGVLTGAVAAVMLLIGGEDALQGLQNVTIIAALPFAAVMVGLAVSLTKDLQRDPMILRDTLGTEVMEKAVVTGLTNHGEDFAVVIEATDKTGETSEGRPEPAAPADRELR